MISVPFSLERAFQFTAARGASSNRPDAIYRCSKPLRFEERASVMDQEPSKSLSPTSAFGGTDRIQGLDAFCLHGPSYSVLDGGRSLLLTHVLRHSPSALKWRNGWGESSILQPGAIFISQGFQDSLVEIAPSSYDVACDCIRIVLRTEFSMDLALRFEAHDFPHCNSPSACVRVMLGSYQGRVAVASPLPHFNMLDIELAPLSEIEIPVAADQWALAVLTSGSLLSSGALVEPWHAVAFDGSEPLARLATRAGASILWLSAARRALHI